MFRLDLNVSMSILVPEKLNARLEDGDPKAFLELELELCEALHAYSVTKLEIQEAGPHNTVYREDNPSSDAS